MVPDRGVPLIVLTRCSAARSDRTSTFPGSAGSPDEGASVLESFARGLLEHGVPGVIGMTQPVSDRYAVQFTRRFYQSLADRSDAPDPLSALSDARRQVETARNAVASDDDQEAEPAQWQVPVLFLRGAPRPLYDISDSAAASTREPLRRNRGFGVRQVKDMVGRRTELRSLLALMRSEQPAVLIRGLGGVGKTTVAERLAGTLTKETGHVVAVAEGRVTPTEILAKVVRALSSLARNRLEDDPLKRTVGELRNVQMPWRDQLDLIEDDVLPEVRVTLILDEAEQNLPDDGLPPGQDDPDGPGPPQTLDPEFGDFLASWLDLMPQTRLIITSRTGLPLPPGASGLLTECPLGPLSRAEAIKLMWRLPGIDALGRAEQDRAYVDVGGHPRALEYLDSLLRGGNPLNRNVLDRMERALRRGGVDNPEQWIRTPGRSLDEALAGAVTLISSDVLLDRLLVGLRGRAAHDLFALSSVYRQAVDEIGLNWVMTPGSVAADPERAARLRDAFDRLDAAQRSGRGLVLDHLGLDPALRNQLVRDIGEGTRPADHPGLPEAIHELVERNLLSVTGPPEAQRYLVHRWTALGLQQLVQSAAAGHLGREDLAEAHRRAAAFHEWRAGLWRTTVTDLLEARYHHHAAGDFGPAAVATAGAGAVLYRWGEFDHVMRLCQETLGWIGSGPEAIELLYLQSLVAGRRENWDDSGRLADSCFELADQAGDRRWTAMCELQLGGLAQETGDHAEAERHYNTARDIAHDVEDVALIGLCYSRLGALELARHHEEEGLFWSRGAIGPLLRRMPYADLVAKGFDELRDLAAALGESELSARLGRRAARRRETDRDLQRVAAEALQQFGKVNLRRERLDNAKADYASALEFAVQLEDRLLEMDCYLGLGQIAQLGGRLMTARQYYRDYLDIADTLRNRIGTVECYQFLGDLAKATGDRPGVQRWYGRALELATRIGDDRLVAQAHLGLGRAHREVGEYAAAKEEYRKAEETSRGLGAPALDLVAEILLDQGASASEQGDLDEAEKLYRDARSAADQAGDLLSVVKANLGLAAVSSARGHPADARALAQRALDRAEEQGHPRLVFDAVLELGRIEEGIDNPQAAAQLYLHGLTKAKELGESSLMIDFSLRLGNLANGTAAFGWYDQALEWLEKLGDLAQAARLRVIIGQVALLDYDDIPRAQADFTRALDLLGKEEDSTDAVEARLGLARAALAENNAETAGTWFGKAAPLADRLGVVDLQAQSYQGLGVVAQLGGELEAASQFHTQVTQLTRAAGSSPAALEAQAEAQHDLARLAWRTGRLDDALADYETALELAETIRAPWVDVIACAQQIIVICDQLAEQGSEDEPGRLTARAAELRERYPEVIRYPLDTAQTEAAAAVAAIRARIGAALTAAGRPDEAVGFTGVSLVYQLLHQREDADRQLDVLRRQQQALGERIRPIMTAILSPTGTDLLLDQL
jgi:tetratricopeptide (TPR) repeat protein